MKFCELTYFMVGEHFCCGFLLNKTVFDRFLILMHVLHGIHLSPLKNISRPLDDKYFLILFSIFTLTLFYCVKIHHLVLTLYLFLKTELLFCDQYMSITGLLYVVKGEKLYSLSLNKIAVLSCSVNAKRYIFCTLQLKYIIYSM